MKMFRRTSKESRPPTVASDSDEAFEGFVEALGMLPPELLRDPDGWLGLTDSDSLEAVCGNLARVPVLSERWG